MSKKRPEIEMRFAEIGGIEIRADSEDKQKYVRGVGIVYDTEIEIWPGYFEKIRAGAFDKTLKSDAEIKSFFNHDPDHVLSTTRSSPALALRDKLTGLEFDSPIPDTTYGRDLIENLTRGNVRGASFAFTINDKGSIWTEDKDGNIYREIIDATLYEVGPVTNPAYPQTSVGVRSRDDLLAEAREYFRVGKPDINEPAQLALDLEVREFEPVLEKEEREAETITETTRENILLRNASILEFMNRKLNLIERSVS